MNTVSIQAAPRSIGSKQELKTSRAEGSIPAVIYGHVDPIHISVSSGREIKNLIYTQDFKVAEVNLNGEVHKCIVKDIQFHPVSDKILHIDFLKLTNGIPVKVEIPIRFKGESPGVKLGGKLVQTMRKLKIKTDPENLQDELLVDISPLGLGDVLRVKSIEVPENMEVLVGGSIPIANIEIPRALKAAAAAEAKAAAGGKKKK